MKRHQPRLALILVGLTAVACQSLRVPPPADETCAGSARDYSGTVVASFITTVGSVRTLEPRLSVPVRWSDLAPGHPAVLCYIDGQIAKAPPLGPDGEIQVPFDRAVVAVVEGDAQLIVAGHRNRLPVEAPPP